MTRRSFLPLLSMLLAIPACDAGASRPAPNAPAHADAVPSAAPSSSASSATIAPSASATSAATAPTTTPATNEAAAKAAAGSTVAFGDDLLAKIDGSGNVVFAPASISAALAMTYGGARGQTATEMAKTLRIDDLAADAVHASWGQLLSSWSVTSEKEPRLEVANRLFGQKGFAFLPDFLALTKDRYGAPLETLDFADTEPSRRRINEWVSDRTAKAIPDLIGKGVLTKLTRLVLVNAIHVKGAWQEPFGADMTKPEAFHVNAKDAPKVPTMHGRVDGRLFAGPDAQILAMPFTSAGALDLEVDFVLPRDGSTASLAAWSRAIDGASFAAVDVSLPKFKVKSSMQLAKTLAAMGMPLAFSEKDADFSGMTGKKDLVLDAVIHEAVLDVNEHGAEAAAATAVVMRTKGMLVNPKKLAFDRPFYVMIRDRKSGAMLFVAHVRDPRA